MVLVIVGVLGLRWSSVWSADLVDGVVVVVVVVFESRWRLLGVTRNHGSRCGGDVLGLYGVRFMVVIIECDSKP